MPKIKSKYFYRAFTLIELLIVIAVIGVLASVVLVRMSNARDKAKYAEARGDLNQFSKVAQMARLNTGKVLGRVGANAAAGITGSGCSGCPCWPGYAFTNPTNCVNQWNNALTAIGNAAGSNLTSMQKDPWGYPYSLDENELENGSCGGRDTIRTCGPDSICQNADDVSISIPFFSCPG